VRGRWPGCGHRAQNNGTEAGALEIWQEASLDLPPQYGVPVHCTAAQAFTEERVRLDLCAAAAATDDCAGLHSVAVAPNHPRSQPDARVPLQQLRDQATPHPRHAVVSECPTRAIYARPTVRAVCVAAARGCPRGTNH
jgi:hypothetical protein